MIPMPIMQALVKGGIIGAVLAWALLENSRLNERLFVLVENNTRALESIKSEQCADVCREASK